MASNDTIAAVSTPTGTGGLAVVRLSGAEALPIALRHLSVEALEPRRATYCRFFTGGGDYIDDGIAVCYPAPRSYTGETVVELSCHGSVYVQQLLLSALLESGARLAEPGEFTLRAFRAGRLNLSQAEAVADLIEAATPAQHRLAVSQLRGGYAKQLKQMRQQLVDLTSLLELELDFSQEDVEFADRTQLASQLHQIAVLTSALLDSFSMGNAIKQGVPVAIVGQPNVGKSTLLNALLHDDRAIVSPVPGTTRDTVEGLLTIGDITFRLIDTAGLRTTDDEVERLGIERSRRAEAEAFVVLEVRDAAALVVPPAPPEKDGEVRHRIVVYNKSDLSAPAFPEEGGVPQVAVSALTGEGLDRLRQMLSDAVGSQTQERVLLTNLRHRDALVHVQHAVDAARHGLDEGQPADLLAVDLRDALYHIGSITGEVTSEEILSNIFSHFCIGK